MLLLLIALQLADIGTTWIALKGGASEANPLAKLLFDKTGHPFAVMLLAKTLGTAPIVLIDNPWVTAIYCLGLGYVLANNVSVLRSQRMRKS